MAANKFASMLHRSSNRIVVILVYAWLEWVLIFFLLINSLFSYFITKFASFVGLPAPCIWCSRLDLLFEPKEPVDHYRSLICENHAIELSKLGYCFSHGKFGQAHRMCMDCSSSLFTLATMKRSVSLLSIDSGDAISELDAQEKDHKCSCCSSCLQEPVLPSWWFVKSSCRFSNFVCKSNEIVDKVVEYNSVEGFLDVGHPSSSDCLDSIQENQRDYRVNLLGDQTMQFRDSVDKIIDGGQIGTEKDVDISVDECENNAEACLSGMFSPVSTSDGVPGQVCLTEDRSLEIVSQSIQESIPNHRLVPVELIDSLMTNSLCPSIREDIECSHGNEPAMCSETSIHKLKSIVVNARGEMGVETPIIISKSVGKQEPSSTFSAAEYCDDFTGNKNALGVNRQVFPCWTYPESNCSSDQLGEKADILSTINLLKVNQPYASPLL